MKTMPRRHPADVTADRLMAHYEQWFEVFSASERDAIGIVIQALREVEPALANDRESNGTSAS